MKVVRKRVRNGKRIGVMNKGKGRKRKKEKRNGRRKERKMNSRKRKKVGWRISGVERKKEGEGDCEREFCGRGRGAYCR